MIRNMRGTIFAVNAGASGVPRGQQQNSPARNGSLRSRERRFKSCRGHQIRIAVPWDRSGSFGPKIVPKGQQRLPDHEPPACPPPWLSRPFGPSGGTETTAHRRQASGVRSRVPRKDAGRKSVSYLGTP
jgi:Transposase, Mutator family